MVTTKYPRTMHIPGSPGTGSDDRIAADVNGILHTQVLVQEKLDGEGNCLNRNGVFSRSHGAPTRHPWCNNLKERWELIKNDLGPLAIYGENLYAVHSIEYSRLEEYFHVFAVKDIDKGIWLSWEEVQFYARFFDLPTVPVLHERIFSSLDDVLDCIETEMGKSSVFSDGSLFHTPKEGVVIKKASEYADEEFSSSVLKWVRAGHVQTDEHWTRNWKRAFLHYELLKMKRREHEDAE